MIKKLLFFAFILIVSFHAGFKGYRLYQERQPIHLYMDIATIPSFLQMIEFVKAPQQDKKYIAWRRFPDREQFFDLNAFNAHEIKMPVYESAYKEAYETLDKAVSEIVQENPHARFIIHANLRHPHNTLEPALKHLAPSQIKEIHLYEDGLGNIAEAWRKYATSQYNWTDTCVQHIKDFQNAKIDTLRPHNVFCLNRLYPTIYHISFVDYLKKESDFEDFFKYINETHIVPIDFHNISKELSPQQKKFLYAMVGFNDTQYKQVIKGKHTLFYTLGWLQEQSDNILLVDIFNKLKNNELKSLMNPSSGVLFFKAHPATAAKPMTDELMEDNKDAYVFPRNIPLEILIIAGLEPDYLLGFSSTIFFAFQPKTILYYLTIEDDKNLPLLKKLNILSDEKVIDIHNFIHKER